MMDAGLALSLLDHAGMFAFALSGGPTAVRHRLDIIGVIVIALLTVVGASKALQLVHRFLAVVIMGTMTATAGGLMRDVVCNETPLLLRSTPGPDLRIPR